MLLVQHIFPATVCICLSSVLRHFSHLCEEKIPRERCVNLCDVIRIFSHWTHFLQQFGHVHVGKKYRSVLCCQNHFSQLSRHQTNNYCYFLLDWFFVSVALWNCVIENKICQTSGTFSPSRLPLHTIFHVERESSKAGTKYKISSFYKVLKTDL